VKELRELFPITKELVYLNSASITPLSLPVKEAIEECLQDQLRYGDRKYEDEWSVRLKDVRRKVAKLIGASSDEIAILRNTVEGLSAAASGLDWKGGDNVVTNNLEHPANMYPWMNLEDRFGVEVRIVPARSGRVITEDLFAATDDRTKVITVSFVEFSNGFRNDLEAIGNFCREKGIYLVMDAIQGLGALELDVKRLGVDFLSAGAHKWLLGPVGIGCFYCRKELLDKVWLTHPGHLSVVAPGDATLAYGFILRPGAERFEGGANNFLGIYGFNASLDIIEQAGVENIEKHVLRLTDLLVSRLQDKGYRILSSLDSKERSGIISFTHTKYDPAQLVQRLLDAKIVVALREGGIRTAVHLYNNEEDIERLSEALP
jgi:cysteine desulfurase/selenocysteine lyase